MTPEEKTIELLQKIDAKLGWITFFFIVLPILLAVGSFLLGGCGLLMI